MMKHNIKSIFFISALVLLLFIVSVMWMKFHHHEHEKIENKYPITNPWRQDVDIKKQYVAQIKAFQHIEIRSMEKGYLQNIYVDEGQSIKKGQKMFQIMPVFAQAEFEKAKAEYQLSKIEYDNSLILTQKGIVSENELALSKAKLDKATAEMNLAKAHLDFTEIKAPFDGIMDRFQVRLGSLLEEGELLTKLSDNSKMWVYFNVTESDYVSYMNHKRENEEPSVKLQLADGSIFKYDGVIDTIEADFDNTVGNIAFRASFKNPDSLLRHGETGSVILNRKYKDVLVIPQKATFEVLDKKYVYVVDDKNRVSSKEIEIEDELEHLFIIKSGVTQGDKILLEGLGKVVDSQVIESFFEDKETVIKNLTLPVEAEIEHGQDHEKEEDNHNH